MKTPALFLVLFALLCISATNAFVVNNRRRSTSPSIIRNRQEYATSSTATQLNAVAKKKKTGAKKKAAKKKTAAKKVAEPEPEPVVTVRKPEFVASIAEKTGMTKADSEAALAAVLETISEEVAAGKRISMVGFGTFKLTRRAARAGRNPRTGEAIEIKASNSPSFSAGKAFKEKCNE